MASRASKVLPTHRLTLPDRLSRLTFLDACKLLGPGGKDLIESSANLWQIDIEEDVLLGADLFLVRFPKERKSNRPTVVTITLMSEARDRLAWNCTQCDGACQHVGAAFSLILEEKTALGLAAPPPEPRTPMEILGETELIERALADRLERSKTENMTVRSIDSTIPWTDYMVTNRLSGKTYRVALRGFEPGESYCSCPDFQTNTLGTCKHIMNVMRKVQRRFKAGELQVPYQRENLELQLQYDSPEVSLRLLVPEHVDEAVAKVIRPLQDQPITDLSALMKRLSSLQKLGAEVVIHPDAEELIQQRMLQDRLRATTESIRANPAEHSLRTGLLKVPLLPYQLDGVAFAAGAGRAILADEMGLGKTIQGVGVAELLAIEAGIKKVLVICPASLKSQWRSEIQRFSDRSVQLVSGDAASRADQYRGDAFFTVCNYEQVMRDILSVDALKWDLIILDEGQRIKNYESKTSIVIKSLRSRFALVLSGTPLENRLDELFSVVQFIDDRRLGPGFRFFNQHRMVDEKGKVLGYRNLGELRERLKPILLRRTRESVKLELPDRTVEIARIPPTDEQLGVHHANMQIVAAITRKKFLNEMDLLRLKRVLLTCRMVANSTYLVDKKTPAYSSKLAHLEELLERLGQEEGRKTIVFSEWTTMLNLIEPILKKRKQGFVRLDGSVPQKKRAELVARFQKDPSCAFFLTTNAGSVGLNLHAANTVINVDLPWNPAVVEQRIARAHRMGQVQPVQVFVLVTEGTIEESLLMTLAAKKDLALAALDVESEVDRVDLASGLQELKNRLEILLGAIPEGSVDESLKRRELEELKARAHRERVASAGGELLGAAFHFLGELVSGQVEAPPPEALVSNLRSGLAACVEQEPGEKPRLTVTLPDTTSLDSLALTLARLVSAGQGVGPA